MGVPPPPGGTGLLGRIQWKNQRGHPSRGFRSIARIPDLAMQWRSRIVQLTEVCRARTPTGMMRNTATTHCFSAATLPAAIRHKTFFDLLASPSRTERAALHTQCAFDI